MTVFDVFTLARTIYGEARSEPLLGKIAVAWVARNRFAARRWFGVAGLAELCQRPSQFPCWDVECGQRARLLKVTLDDPLFQDSMYAALAVIRGHEPDPTGGATHYHAATGEPPDWAEGLTPTATIGDRAFYRGVG